MPAVYYIHGFSAGELYLDSARQNLLWVDTSNLVRGGWRALELAANGVDALPPPSVPLIVGGPLTPYVDEVMATIRRGLNQTNYDVGTWSYDWRMSLAAAGAELAHDLIDNHTAADPAVLVAHSAGGHVARAAWRQLVRQSKQNIVRRIIAIGTPHYGTYYAVGAWSGLGDLVQQLSVVGAVNAGQVGSYIIGGAVTMTLERLIAVALTWPALYQLLPVLGAPDAGGDATRAVLFSSPSWSGIAGRPSQLHLDAAQNTTFPFLLDPLSMPPPWILTVVYGVGYSTWDGLVDVNQLGKPAALRSTLDGDGVVTAASAKADADITYQFTAQHSDLPVVFARSGQLTYEILAVRTPPTPTSVSSVDVLPQPVELHGPPYPGLGGQPVPRCHIAAGCTDGC